MLILGLNMFHADASAAIIQDGEVIFAIAEERLNRIKHYAGFPSLAIKACLDAAGAKMTDVDHVAVGQDSDANLSRKVQYALANPAKILNFIRLRQRKKAMRDVRSQIATSLDVDPVQLGFQEHHLEHHIAHIASAYYCSPWERAAGFSYDGSGDFVSTMMARCEGNEIEVLDRVFLPHSLGGFYTMICEFIGYKKYGDEGKVMGLAPYGKETYCEQIRHILDLNGSLALNLSYFKPLGSNEGMQISSDGTVSLARHFSDRMVKLFGEPRQPQSDVTRRDIDLAYAMQHCFEEAFFHLLNNLHRKVPGTNGVGAARLGQPVDCGASRTAQYEGRSQRPYQAPRVVPSIRSVNSRRAPKRVFRARPSFSVYAPRLQDPAGKTCTTLRGEPRRRYRPSSERQPGRKPALLRFNSGFRAQDRYSGNPKHQL